MRRRSDKMYPRLSLLTSEIVGLGSSSIRQRRCYNRSTFLLCMFCNFSSLEFCFASIVLRFCILRFSSVDLARDIFATMLKQKICFGTVFLLFCYNSIIFCYEVSAKILQQCLWRSRFASVAFFFLRGLCRCLQRVLRRGRFFYNSTYFLLRGSPAR